MLRSLIISALFLLLVCPHDSLLGRSLHAIFIIDTVHEIQNITKPDLESWKREARSICQYGQMTLKEKIFSGASFRKEKIQNYLTRMEVEKKDVVIFYFSGHGYRTMQKSSPWPFLTLDYHRPGLDLSWVSHTIRSKKPQFALIMSDCCNNYMEQGMFGKEIKHICINLKPVSPHTSGYKQLFNKAKGCIVVSSCSEGQFSYGSSQGGLYTHCFFSSLSRELWAEKPSWKRLLERANGFIHPIQNPICRIYAHSNS